MYVYFLPILVGAAAAAADADDLAWAPQQSSMIADDTAVPY